MYRSINKTENEWIRSALEQEKRSSGLNIEQYISQVYQLKVIEECDCDDPFCFSVKFSNYEPGASRSIANATVNLNDGKSILVIVYVHAETSKICEIETIN